MVLASAAAHHRGEAQNPTDRKMEKDCPQCGERMRLQTREVLSRVPGTSQDVRTLLREWVCRECDYFEEDDRKVRDEKT
jgi:C4-type Zn-finger protein